MTATAWVSKRKRRLALGLVLVVVICLSLIFLNRWSNQPTTRAITITSPANSPSARPSYVLIKNAYFATSIPSGWKFQQNPSSTTSPGLSLVAFAPSDSDGQIAIETQLLPSSGLSGVANYNLRQTDPTTYVPVHDADLPAGSSTFQVADDGINDTLFMTNGSRYASISVTGATTASAMTLLKEVINSWKWQ